ncbi:MAG: GrpB family protein, partial [Candidatus Dormibacteraeota bacterium]|nr:GrpB family protein [Candidatus Dormibacteraeota bacterium]
MSWIIQPSPLPPGGVVLVAYDPAWPSMFEQLAARIRSALGDRLVQIEHVGSTSVPGLRAKAIIDIALAVPASADEGAYAPDLER